MCYLAPERFLADGEKDDGRGVTWAMDVFSAGCVIAELFLEAPIFSLSQLYKYRKGEYHPEYGHLSKIKDPEIRDMVTHMIQLEPEARYSAEEYLNFWRRKAFPEYFYSFLHQYMGLITDPSSGKSPVIPDENFGEADDRIERVYYDFDKISYFLGYEIEKTSPSQARSRNLSGDILPLEIDLPNNRHEARAEGRSPVDDGSLIFLTLVVSSLRNTARSAARVHALDLMLAFAEKVTDEAKLDRVLPYVVSLLNDRSDMVKIAAVRTMTQLLALVTVVSPINVNIFSEYVRPRLLPFVHGPGSKMNASIRATYASCLASLAHTSAQILDTVHALRADGTIPAIDPEAEGGDAIDLAYQNAYDVAKVDLLAHFESQTKALLTDPDPSVRRAFLGSVSSLCVFFGGTRANDVVLSHLNTYLNDKDWMLKCAFFSTVVGVAAFVGGTNFEEYILPLMLQSLTDPEEFVVEQVVTSLANIADLGLIQRSKTWELIDILARFLVHPNVWIKEATAHFIAASIQYLSLAEIHCIVAPLIHPYTRFPVQEFTEFSILDALKAPLPRSVLDMALIWAGKAQSGTFWRPVQQSRTFSFGPPNQSLATISSKDLQKDALMKISKNEEDDQWLNRLRNIGMSYDDDFKLLALREYIWRIAQKRAGQETNSSTSELNGVFPLKDIKVTPQTVFFEMKPKRGKHLRRTVSEERQRTSNKLDNHPGPHTIADALLDASTNINDPLLYRRRSHANAVKGKATAHDPMLPGRQKATNGDTSSVVSPMSSSPGRHQGSKDVPISRQSDGTLTPTDSLKARDEAAKSSGVRHKSSAINLLNRNDTTKSGAETGTSPANAVGKIDGGITRTESLEALPIVGNTGSKKRQPSSSPMPAGHTYDGGDPNVLRLLDSLALENYPADVIDFGPMVTPVRANRSSNTQPDSQGLEKPWRPEGTLIATFGEHTAPINRVLPSPDHAFFLTGSDDGSVKVWDTMRLERNLAHRSRQTFTHSEGARITSLCFVENTHTFVSAASDGTIKVVKVDYTLVNDASKYGKLRQARHYRLDEGEQAIWLEHYKADTYSLLLMATNLSRIIALDLRNMTEIYKLENPIHHGVPTCFCVDKVHGWLLLGTSHGILSLWDLRFRLRLKAFGLSGGTPIHRLILHPFRSRSRRVVVAGGTGQAELTVWDIEKSECREVFRAGIPKGSNTTVKEHFTAFDAWKVDDERPEGMLGRFATAIDAAGSQATAGLDRGVRALAVRLDDPDEKGESKTGFYLTGGMDCKLRLWDTWRPDASMVLSGLDAEEDPPKFSAIQPTTGLIVHSERVSAPPQPEPSRGDKNASPAKSAGAKGSKNTARQPRSTVIGVQQKALLRSHLDVITDMCILERPTRMTVSVDRMGCIYVFQ